MGGAFHIAQKGMIKSKIERVRQHNKQLTGRAYMDRPCAYSPMDYVDDAPVFGHFTQRTFSQFNIRG